MHDVCSEGSDLSGSHSHRASHPAPQGEVNCGLSFVLGRPPQTLWPPSGVARRVDLGSHQAGAKRSAASNGGCMGVCDTGQCGDACPSSSSHGSLSVLGRLSHQRQRFWTFATPAPPLHHPCTTCLPSGFSATWTLLFSLRALLLLSWTHHVSNPPQLGHVERAETLSGSPWPWPSPPRPPERPTREHQVSKAP